MSNSVFRSSIFTFLIGENKTPIAVHAEAIAKHSKALNALINGGMEEAKAGRASLPDVSEDTFLRFCQYAYAGDYSTPPFTTIEAEAEEVPVDASDWPPPPPPPGPGSPPFYAQQLDEEEPAMPLVDADSYWGSFVPPNKKKKGNSATNKMTSLWDSFSKLSFNANHIRHSFVHSCIVVENSSDLEDFTPVFLAHSRLYVFADKYGIEPLKLLTLEKLHQTLVGFKCFEKRLDDVTELVRFSYCNDNTPDEGKDHLRDLVLQFITCKQDIIRETESFLALLEESGPLARDFWLSVRKSLLT
jgi:hypothetical protein